MSHYEENERHLWNLLGRDRGEEDDTIEEHIVRKIDRLDRKLESIMATLQEVLDADAQVGDEINQVIALLNQDTALIAQLQGAIGSGNLTPEQQANVDNLFGQLNTQRDQIVAALTPAAPAPPVEEPPVDTTPPADAPTPDPVNG